MKKQLILFPLFLILIQFSCNTIADLVKYEKVIYSGNVAVTHNEEGFKFNAQSFFQFTLLPVVESEFFNSQFAKNSGNFQQFANCTFKRINYLSYYLKKYISSRVTVSIPVLFRSLLI